MRIGHVTTHFLPIAGGQESYLAELLALLEREGHEQHVYQFDTGVEDPRLRTVPRPPRRLLELREGMPYWLYSALLPLRALDLRREDLLIVHFPVHYPAVAWHPRVVVLSHGVEWDQPARRLPHRLRRAIARHAFRKARVVVANDSNFLREMGLDVAPGTRLWEEVAPRRFFLPNAIDPRRFAPGEPLAAIAALSPVLVPRNVWPGRGIHLAIEAWGRIADRFPRVSLLVAGAFWDAGYRELLLRRVGELGLQTRVLFAGAFPWENMARLYSSSRVTLIPSLRAEGTSLAALESMGTGTPVVTTTVGGLRDLPALQAPPEPGPLAEALSRALEQRDELGRAQRAAVLEGFSLERWSAGWRRAIEAASA